MTTHLYTPTAAKRTTRCFAATSGSRFLSALAPTLIMTLTIAITTMITSSAYAQFCQLPTANAGSDIGANEGAFVQLDGSGSLDPDFNGLQYSWLQISGPAALSLIPPFGSATPTVQVPYVGGTGATMTFQLIVLNACGDTSSDTVNVTINPILNLPPVAGATAPATVAEGATVTLNGSSSYDPETNPLTYTWLQTMGPTVSLNLTDPANPTFVAPVTGVAYQLQFSLSVFDGQYNSNTVLVDIAVSPANQAPTAVAGPAQTVAQGAAVELDGSASSDPENQTLTYSWSQTEGTAVVLDLTNPAKPKFTAPSVTGVLKFSLVVNDGSLNSAASTILVSVFPEASIPNCANARPNKKQLWPPKHNMARVKIRGMEVSEHDKRDRNDDEDKDKSDKYEHDDDADDIDEASGKVEIRILAVTQDEPTLGTGAGDTGPDAIVDSARPDGSVRLRDLLLLRKERSDSGDGRVYEIEFMATNTLSNSSCTGNVQICVPTKKGKKGQCVDSGQGYDSTQ